MNFDELPLYRMDLNGPQQWDLVSVVLLSDLPQLIAVSEKLPPPCTVVCVYYADTAATPAEYGCYFERRSATGSDWWEDAAGNTIRPPTHWRGILR